MNEPSNLNVENVSRQEEPLNPISPVEPSTPDTATTNVNTQTTNSIQIPGMESKTEQQKPYELESNVEAAFAYMLGPFTGLLVLMNEKRNAFIRFHAAQSVLTFGGWIFVWIFFAFITPPALAGITNAILNIGSFAIFLLWLFLMWKAYNNEEFMLPFVGEMAKKQISKNN